MNALLLSAGHGERLKPLTSNIPKPCLPVLNLTCFEYNLRYIFSFGVKKFIANSYHLAEKLEDEYSNIELKDLELSFSKEKELLGTGGGIKKMLGMTEDDVVLISNTDIIHNFDLNDLVKQHKQSGRAVNLVLKDHPKNSYSKVGVNPQGLIINFSADSNPKNKGHKTGVFTGIHILTKSRLPKMPKINKFCIVKDYYRNIVNSKGQIGGLFAKGDWLDFGDINKYFEENMELLTTYNRFNIFKQQIKAEFDEPRKGILIHKSSKIGSNIKFQPPVLIDKEVKIKGSGLIGPKVIVCSGSTIFDVSEISKSLILRNAALKDQKELKNKILEGKNQINTFNI